MCGSLPGEGRKKAQKVWPEHYEKSTKNSGGCGAGIAGDGFVGVGADARGYASVARTTNASCSATRRAEHTASRPEKHAAKRRADAHSREHQPGGAAGDGERPRGESR